MKHPTGTDNLDLAVTLMDLADRRRLLDPAPHRSRALATVASSLMAEPIAATAHLASGSLRSIPGVGAAIEEILTQLIEAQPCPAVDEAIDEIPPTVLQLTRVAGIGLAGARRIAEQHQAAPIEDIIATAQAGELTGIRGIGPAAIASISAHVPAARHARLHTSPLLRGEADSVATGIAGLIEASGIPGTMFRRRGSVACGGSYARGHELVDVVDLMLVATDGSTDPAELIADATQLLESYGWTPAADDPAYAGAQHLMSPAHRPVRLWGAAPDTSARTWVAAVGPREFVDIAIREPERAGIAEELRDAAAGGEDLSALAASDLVTEDAIRGELHSHSTWSDGTATILDMALAAAARGNEYLVVTDHSAPHFGSNGLTADRVRAQVEEIHAAQAQVADRLTLLHGIELEIAADGTLGLPDDVLEQLDWVIASIHVSQRQGAAEIRNRMEGALRNPLVDCIGHPTSRLLLNRPPTALDVGWLIEQAAATGTHVELNSHPDRLDLSSANARLACDEGVLVCIDTDAHRPEGLDLRCHGISLARRARLAPADVVNTRAWADVARLRPRHR